MFRNLASAALVCCLLLPATSAFATHAIPLVNMMQQNSNGSPLADGGVPNSISVQVRAASDDPTCDGGVDYYLDVQITEMTAPWPPTSTYTTATMGPKPTCAIVNYPWVTLSGLQANEAYRWRARERLSNGEVAAWMEYSGNTPSFVTTDADSDGYFGGEDCDDNDNTTYIGAPELCDGVDNNCNSTVDDGWPDYNSNGISDCTDPVPAGAIIITEVMQNPSAVGDSDGEWFEVHNTLSMSVDLIGWTLSDLGNNTDTIASSVVVAGGGYAVLARNSDMAANGGVSTSYEYDTSFALGNDDDEIILTNSAGIGADLVMWDDGATMPDPTGASMTLSPNFLSATGNDLGANWCASTGTYGDGDSGTPGQPNSDIDVDVDGDGIIDCQDPDNDNDGDPDVTDCDDLNPNNSSIGTEVCDGFDNDCSGGADFDTAGEVDGDTDGYLSCADCDDANAAINPAATELCDGLDNNCTGSADFGQVLVSTVGPTGPIADNSSTLFVASVSATDPTFDLNVSVDITHTWVSDLTLTLTSPDGTAVELIANLGSSGDDMSVTVFDDEATAAIGSASPPFTGSWIPNESLSAFDGTSPLGDWTLQISDAAPWDTGTLNSWSLDFALGSGEADSDMDTVLACADCDDNDAAAFPGNLEVCDGIDNDCSGSADAPASTPASGSSAPGLIIGNFPNDYITDGITIGSLGTVVDVNVTVDITHDYDADLDLVLTGPGGASVLLVSGAGGSGDDFAGTIFDDQAGSSIYSGSAPFAGSYAPDEALGLFNGGAAAGQWTLEVTDTYPTLDDGVLNSWSLEIVVSEGEGDSDSDGSLACADCDDTDSANFPGNAEVCDGFDNDCSGSADADAAGEVDADADMFLSCADCDDAAAAVNPGATEACNGIDDDCNGSADFDAAGEVDADGDGDLSCSDCDDGNSSNFSGNPEVCDGADNDCNGSADADADGEIDFDQDGDLSCSDCDDNDGANFNGNVEVCDGYDNDCNGWADFVTSMGDDDDDDDDSAGDDDDSAGDDDDSAGDDDDSAGDDDDSAGDDDDSAEPEYDSEELDVDGDDYLACADDCDDESEDFAPDAPELCDGLDNDCDGAIPADEADADMDGQMECEGDCDDDDDTTYLGAAEVCDGIDNDCDTTVDDEELDTDGDGLSPCEGDCDDTNAAVNPDAPEDSAELCADTLDNDCDGDVDADDSDCDGLIGDDDDDDDDDSAGDDDDDDAAGDDDDAIDGGCDCTVSGTEGTTGYGLLLLGLLGLHRRRRR